MNPFGGTWGWMYWNLTLAVVPLLLSFVVFRRGTRTNAWFWIGAGAFVAFLPNAPYVLTDVEHLRWDILRADASTSELGIRYGTLFAIGMTAYAVAMWRCSRFLSARAVRVRWIIVTNISACAICSLGIYVGRVHRLNSWDLVRAPHAVLRAALTGFSSNVALAGMAMVFVATAVAASIGIMVLEAIAALARRQAP
jgi:uncharacterized membrane protein